jgi:agmatine deiminase
VRSNGAVIVPQFNVPTDAEALKTIRSFFPDREVIGLYSREVLLGGGNLHCITMQQPLLSF